MQQLPVFEVLPEIRFALEKGNRLVLQAPPGAGKTTAVPLALLDAPWLGEQLIIMLEPRRLAARNAAMRMAQMLGEQVGERVGYHIRADRKMSQKTKILVVTEGILTRYLQNDPALENAALVIFDEFHERSLHADLGLALALQSQELLREELKLLVMSATLNTEAVSALLTNAPVITSEGRCFPVEHVYLPHTAARSDVKHMPAAVAKKVEEALKHDGGSILVFLPGVREIRAVEARVRGHVHEHYGDEVHLSPLYGDLSKAEQDAAISPAPPGKRKVVLATNIAETSLTIEGISVVVDVGLQRVSRFSAGSGMNRLETVNISQDAAEQRSGRAGRTGPGKCYRLWHEHTQLVRHATPEILTADLSPMMLELARWGVQEPDELHWLDRPPEGAVNAAQELLRALGALDANNRITPHGEALLELGVYPRLGHMMLRAKSLGIGYEASLVAALLSERDILRGNADMATRMGLLHERGEAYVQVKRSANDYLRRLGLKRTATIDTEVAGVLLGFAYPERIAKNRGGRDGRYLLSGGKGGVLGSDDALAGEKFLAIGDLDGASTEARIYLAAPLDEAQIGEYFADLIVVEHTVRWNEEMQRVEAKVRRRLGALLLEERHDSDVGEEQLALGLCDGIRSRGLAALPWSREASAFRQRVAFLRAQQHDYRAPEEESLPDMSDDALLVGLEEWLLPHLMGMKSVKACEKLDMLTILKGLCNWETLQRIDTLAPEKIEVPTGSKIAIDYSDPLRPLLAVRLQELFGLAQTPAVLGGRVALSLHLLSPARRPLQVTKDLKGFWEGSYSDVKKEMKGRYPKHYWPDNPLEAEATRKTKKQMGR